jgi:CDP-glucose 4,6-dehydratase
MEVVNPNFYHGKNVLVTGHTGFKGSWLSIWLNKLGANVTGFALEPPTNPSMFNLCSLRDHINSIIGDVRNRDSLKMVIYATKPEIIFHLAAQPLVGESYRNPVETYETNIMGTVNLLDVVKESPWVKAVVIITSDKVYENKESLRGYQEDDRLGGYDPYSSSKACCEIITDAFRNSFFNPSRYNEHHVAIATVRAGNVIGGGDFAKDRLVPDCIKALMENRKIIIRNPQAIRPWQHVLEPLGGYIELAEKLYLQGTEFEGAWNFGPLEKNEKTVDYIVNKLCHLWSSQAFYEQDKCINPHETNLLKLDSDKARQRMGFRPKWDIDKALEMVLEWTKELLKNEKYMFDVCLSQIEEYRLDG